MAVGSNSPTVSPKWCSSNKPRLPPLTFTKWSNISTDTTAFFSRPANRRTSVWAQSKVKVSRVLFSTTLSYAICQTCSLCDISVGLNQARLRETIRASAMATLAITLGTQVTRPMAYQAPLHLSIAPSPAMLRAINTIAVIGSKSSHTTTMSSLATTTVSTGDFDRQSGSKRAR